MEAMNLYLQVDAKSYSCYPTNRVFKYNCLRRSRLPRAPTFSNMFERWPSTVYPEIESSSEIYFLDRVEPSRDGVTVSPLRPLNFGVFQGPREG